MSVATRVEIEVTVLDIDKIRLKFHNVPEDKGPDMILDMLMARQIINKLQSTLPEYKSIIHLSLARRIETMLMGNILSSQEANKLKEIIDCATKDQRSYQGVIK